MRKLHALPVFVAVLISIREPRTLLYSQVLIGSSFLLYRERKAATERWVSLVTGSSFSLYTLISSLAAVVANRDDLSLQKIRRDRPSRRHMTLFLAASIILASSPGAMYVPLVVWSLITIFFKTERVAALFWVPQIVSSMAYAHFTGDLTLIKTLSWLVALAAVMPLQLVKRRSVRQK